MDKTGDEKNWKLNFDPNLTVVCWRPKQRSETFVKLLPVQSSINRPCEVWFYLSWDYCSVKEITGAQWKAELRLNHKRWLRLRSYQKEVGREGEKAFCFESVQHTSRDINVQAAYTIKTQHTSSLFLIQLIRLPFWVHQCHFHGQISAPDENTRQVSLKSRASWKIKIKNLKHHFKGIIKNALHSWSSFSDQGYHWEHCWPL